MPTCTKHQRYSSVCPDCRNAAEGEYTNQVERELEALKTQNQALLDALIMCLNRTTEDPEHDWTTCDQMSCKAAREAIALAKGE